MDVRERYPTMQPFVGRRFAEAGGPRLLLVGESHYLPDGSTQHVDSAGWYAGSAATLTEEEVHWISTARIVREACKSRFKYRAHWIWKNAFEAINEAGPRYEDYVEVAEDIAFYNFFQRPALQGESLDLDDQDVTVANAVFARTMEVLSPGAVVFVSRLAWRNLAAKTTPAVPLVTTCHPTSAYWNRECKRYGGRTGKQVLSDFAGTLTWPRQPGLSPVS